MHNKAKSTRGTISLLTAACLAAVLPGHSAAQAETTTPESIKGFAESTFNSPVFSQIQSNFQRQNRSVIESVNDAVVAQAKAMLPRAKVLGERLRYGNHAVVSNDGETMIGWMIQLTGATPPERRELLGKLNALAAQNIPEALTFEGFAAEYGLFGVPQNLAQALQFYQAAAARNYQPAIYNLAVAAAYGKGSRPDINIALGYLARASALAPDASYRVCGFAAFLSYRAGDSAQASRYAQSCWSGLAAIPRALYDERVPVPQRVTLLRESIATGIDDGYPLLAKVTHDAGADPQYLACKYMLVDRYRHNLNGNTLRQDAISCYQQTGNIPADPKEALIRYNTVVPGIVGFVPTEVRSLEKERVSNHFHYAWSVPYLPFRQQDVDLFAPFVSHTRQ
ncbi:Sel1 repeat family protein (plasmid) [Paraburkholderia kururiensis]|uniref:tetratricopeptide repeat protein n=1 Tax=Paraburkholderia kururiensis TaxID=984307 RepID=UPI0039A634F3